MTSYLLVGLLFIISELALLLNSRLGFPKRKEKLELSVSSIDCKSVDS